MDLGSTALSWNLWDRSAPVHVDLAGAGHSAAARDFAIKFPQSTMPEALLVWSLLMISALVMNRRRFASVGGRSSCGSLMPGQDRRLPPNSSPGRRVRRASWASR
jgi:hypothetical protein